MAWTTPKTWAVSEFVTAALMNTHLRDNMNEVFRAIDRSNAVVDVQNTASEMSLFDGAAHSALTGWTIPAGVMGASRGIRITVTGDAVYALTDNDNMALRLYVGNQLVVTNDSLFSDQLPYGGREGWRVTAEVWNLAANSQISSIRYDNAFRPGNCRLIVGATTSTCDTTASWKLDITADWTSASTALSFRRRHCVLELI